MFLGRTATVEASIVDAMVANGINATATAKQATTVAVLPRNMLHPSDSSTPHDSISILKSVTRCAGKSPAWTRYTSGGRSALREKAAAELPIIHERLPR